MNEIPSAWRILTPFCTTSAIFVTLSELSQKSFLRPSKYEVVPQNAAGGVCVNLVAANTSTGDTVINVGSRLTLGNNLALRNNVLDMGSTGGSSIASKLLVR